MNKQNAIQQEIEKLEQQWQDFIDTDLPILHWYFSPDSIQLAQTFIKIKEQLDEKNPELFIRLHSEFNNTDDFGGDLAIEMNQAIEAGIADAMQLEKEENISAEPGFQWQAPDLRLCQTGFHRFFRSCKNAVDTFGDFVHNITLVVTPTAVAKPEEYLDWWAQCCSINARFKWPANLRLIVLDTDPDSKLAQLARDNPQHIHSINATANLPQAIQALLKGADDGSTAARFRQCNVDLQAAVGKQDRPAIETYSAAAIAIAKQENWLDLWAVVLLTRAAGYLTMQLFEPALSDYREAQTIAQQGVQAQVPGCDKLHVQARVCEGTCLFSANRFNEAAPAYDQAAQIAEQQDDFFMSLEAWRMASFCMERAKNNPQAWEFGKKALTIGRKMAREQRIQSTMPFLGQALLRISPSAQVRDQVKITFGELLGEDWLENAEQVARAC